MKINTANLLGVACSMLAGIMTLCPPVKAESFSAGKIQPAGAPEEVPEGLSGSDWSQIRAAFERHRHSARPVQDQPGTWRARNPGQQWRTTFDARGFVTEPVADEGAPARPPAWQWGLVLKSYGFSGQTRALEAPPAITTDQERVTYRWNDALTEWFINDARGLEHGFTVNARPGSGAEAGVPLEFELGVRGSLSAQVAADGQGVAFRDASGVTVLNYSGLKVWDADGKVLASRFAPATTSSSGMLRLLVEERAARYPITVDPIAQQVYLKASNPASNERFGSCVSVSGDTVVIGNSSGTVYVFVRSGTTWTLQALLHASNAEAFGSSVSISGDTVVVGAPLEDGSGSGVDPASNNSMGDAGAAFVFVRTGTTWSQQAYLKASNPWYESRFGSSVSVSGDTVVVGAPQEQGSGRGVNPPSDRLAPYAGAAYVFVRNGSTWVFQAYLKSFNADRVDIFGTSVAVSGDTVVVGAPREDGNSTGVNGPDNNLGDDAGAAYVFVRTGTTWSQQAYLKPSSIWWGDEFGNSVAISGDTVVVGAHSEDGSGAGVNPPKDNFTPNAGAAYVFFRVGTSWSQQAYLKASNPGGGLAFGEPDLFGTSVAVSGDTVIVGAPGEDGDGTGVNPADNNSAKSAGAAYLFVRNGATWTFQAYLKASNTGAGDFFGTSVAVSAGTAVVGAIGEDGSVGGVNPPENNLTSLAGASYVFGFDLNTPPALSCLAPAIIPCTSPDGATATLGVELSDANNDPLTVTWTVDGIAVATHTLAAGATSDSLVNQAFGFGPNVVQVAVTDGKSTPLTCQTTVTVTAHDAPVPVLATLPTLRGQCEVSITETPTAADPCVEGGIVLGTTTDALSYMTPGTYTVTWTYASPHEPTLFTTQEQTVIVQDTVPPTLTPPADVTVGYGSVPTAATDLAGFLAQGGTISDNCDPNGTVTSHDATTGVCPVVIRRTYVVTDAAGNLAGCEQLITVNNLFAGDAIIWHQPLARSGMSEDTDPSESGTRKYRFKPGSTIPIQVHALSCGGVDVTPNANVIGQVTVFGDSNCDGVVDGNETPIVFNGVGGNGGVMDKIGGHLKYNLDTKSLPTTTQCFILRVTVTDAVTGEERFEEVLLQAK